MKLQRANQHRHRIGNYPLWFGQRTCTRFKHTTRPCQSNQSNSARQHSYHRLRLCQRPYILLHLRSGFDAFISDKFADEKKRGPLGYVRNIVEGVIEFKSEEYEITYDDGVLNERAFLVTCANASQYGNEAYIAPDTWNMEDGKMNVSILKPLNPNEIPQTTFQLFTKNIDKNGKMISLLTSHSI